jgi:hypothetical protein
VLSTAPAETARKRGYLKLPNYVLDDILPTMRPIEQAVFLRLWRLSYGFGSPRCQVGLPTLARACRASVTQVRFAVKNVCGRGYVRRVGEDHANPNQNARGIVFEMLLPPAETVAPAESTAPAVPAPNKKESKDNNQRGICPDCKNTDWWYPKGVKHGVARCTHPKLREGK